MKGRSISNPWHSREAGSLLLAITSFSVRRLGRLLRVLGVDARCFEELLRARVLLTLRGRDSGHALGGLGLLVIIQLASAILGMVCGVVGLLDDNAWVWVVVSQSGLFFLVAFVLLTLLADILVDPADIHVLAPHPVSGRTLLAVRLAHAFFYLGLCSATFTGANVFLAVLRQPPLAVLFVFPLLSVLCSLTALGFVALSLALLLRSVGPDRLQRVALWVQIAVVAALVGAQGILGLTASVWPTHIERLARLPLVALWPPVQCAALFDLARGELSTWNVWLSLAALVLPLASVRLALALASRTYAAGLEGTLQLVRRPPPAWRTGPIARWGLRRSRGHVRRAGFGYTLALARREPSVLRAVLPLCIAWQAMPLAPMLSAGRRLDWFYLTFSTGSLLALLTLLESAQFTPTPQARWVFLAAPIEDESELLRGGLRSHFLGWWLPFALVVLVSQLVALGFGFLPQALAAHALTLSAGLLMASRFRLSAPFTRARTPGVENFENLAIVVSTPLVYAAVGGLLFGLRSAPWVAWVVLPVLLALVPWSWRALAGCRITGKRRLQSLDE